MNDERFAAAIRALLARPLMLRDDPAWVDVVTHRRELVGYFEDMCGWRLRIDLRSGTARLYKRHRRPDPTRPALRPNRTPMQPDGYVTLMLVCAELISRPTSTLGDLADNLLAAVTADSTLGDFDPTVHTHRVRLAKAIRWLDDAGLVSVTAGDLDRYEVDAGDAVIVANTERIPLLLATDTPPSRIDADGIDEWIDALCDEPRYRPVTDDTADTTADSSVRYGRHMLGRALLDDPAVTLADLDSHQSAYLASGAGRPRLRRGVAAAGMTLEEHADCLVVVDETTESTDKTFGHNTDIIGQVAGVLLDALRTDRDPASVDTDTVEAVVAGLLADDDQWARTYQHERGAGQLTVAALDTLVGFGLVTIDRDTDPSTVTATPAAGRYITAIIDSRGGAGGVDEPTEEDPR